MPDRLLIRPATAADAERLASLMDELNRDQKEETGHVTADAIRRDGFGPRPEFRVLLAELDGAAAGYALFHPTWSTEVGEPGFYLYDLYVRPAARGQGVGRKLLSALARTARDEGRTFLWWSSKAWNDAAQAFYRGLGAVEEPVMAHALLGESFQRLAEER
jgi:GNAT superfamily N-acetyltransferase